MYLRPVGDHVADQRVQPVVVRGFANAAVVEHLAAQPRGELVLALQIIGGLQPAQRVGAQAGHVVVGQRAAVYGPVSVLGVRALRLSQRAQGTLPAQAHHVLQLVELDLLRE